MQTFGVRTVLILMGFGLAACQPTIPESGDGVGFADYNAYEAQRMQREQALNQSSAAVQPPMTPITPYRPVISGDELRSAGLPIGGATVSSPPTTFPSAATGAPLQATLPAAPTVGAASLDTNNPSISDEQDFKAVSGRETIESNAERIAQQRAAYQVVQPTAVPQRPGGGGPNIVAYALSTTNAVGQRVHERSGRNADGKFLRACAGFGSSDRAQEDFLKNGGPQKDSKGLDPDGDGFACYWDPTPFRQASRN